MPVSMRRIAPSLTSEEASARTAALLELVPEEWRAPGLSSRDFAALPSREDCKPLLRELTRAVPITLLLEHGPGALHRASDKSQLSTSDFFRSTPVDSIGAFVSHRWSNDPHETAMAIMLQLKLGFFSLKLMPTLVVCVTLALVVFPPAICVPCSALNYLWVAVLTSKSERTLSQFGGTAPKYWFDKATVQQTEPLLTQAGLALFEYYLTQSGTLLVLFSPEYLSRVWCMYELAWWLSHPDGGGAGRPIHLIPLAANASLYRLTLKYWVIFISFIAIEFAFAAWLGASCSRFYMVADAKFGEGHLHMFMIAWFLVTVLFTCGCGAHICLRTLMPARQERFKAQQLLQSFDVRQTTAWSAADREFVLGKICAWYMKRDYSHEQSLDAFNALIRTTCAAHLVQMQRRAEGQIALGVAFACGGTLLWACLLANLCFGTYRPLLWPSIVDDLARWLSPDACVLAATASGWCNSTEGAGHHLVVPSAACVDNRLVAADLPDAAGCTWAWRSSRLAITAVGVAALIGAAMATGLSAWRWAMRDVIGEPPMAMEPMERCQGERGGVGGDAARGGAGSRRSKRSGRVSRLLSDRWHVACGAKPAPATQAGGEVGSR